jgi:hypothetical protein
MKILTTLTLILLVAVVNSVASSILLTFDTIPLSFPYNEFIPNGYGGFQWQNFGVIDPGDSGPGWNQTGYYYGMISPKNVGFNESAETASMYLTSGLFDLDSAYLTAAYSSALPFSAVGYRNGVAIYNASYTLSETTPTFIQFNFLGVDTVSFSSSPTQFAIDNILVTTPSTVPEPSLLAIFGIGILSMIGFQKRK